MPKIDLRDFFDHFGNFWPKFKFGPENLSKSSSKLYGATNDLKKNFEKIDVEISAPISGSVPSTFGAFLKI